MPTSDVYKLFAPQDTSAQTLVDRAIRDDKNNIFISTYISSVNVVDNEGSFTISFVTPNMTTKATVTVASTSYVDNTAQQLEHKINQNIRIIALSNDSGLLPQEVIDLISQKKSIRFNYQKHVYELSRVTNTSHIYFSMKYDENNDLQQMNKLVIDLTTREYTITPLIDKRIAAIEQDLQTLHSTKVSATATQYVDTNNILYLLTD